ncbi:MAG: DUF5011 domain-containing protein [Candidatus Latescibacteria bacterium]|nr:DUF5011 domain-containing protein [Candidatus Latescibacterota bacterium]
MMSMSRFTIVCISLVVLVIAGCGTQNGVGPVGGDKQQPQPQSQQMQMQEKIFPEGFTPSPEYLKYREELARRVQERDKGNVERARPPQRAAKAAVAAPGCWEYDYGQGLNAWDDGSFFVNIGFSFAFYGNTYTGMWANSNGNITLSGPNNDWWHPNIPDGGNVIIAPLYGDFNPSANGEVYVNTIGTAPNRKAVVTWVVVPEFAGTPGLNTFQAVLFEGSNNILFGYNGLTTDGYNWAGDPTMDVGISSGTGSYINVASGSAIPALDGTNVLFTWNGQDYTASNTCQPAPVNNPPVANAGQDQTVECTSPSGAAVTLDGTGSNDPDGDPLTYSWSATGITFDNPASATPTAIFPLGTTTVTLTVTDPGGLTSTDTVLITVQDTTPPTITLNGDNPITLECPAPYIEYGAVASDVCDPSPSLVISGSVDSHTPGTYSIIYTATDDDGNTASVTRTVNVVDTTPPVVSSSVALASLWPPNHDLVNVGLNASASDACDPNPTINVAVYGDEDDEEPTGDGNHSPDAKNIGLNTLRLRSERKGNADGRVYLIVVTATDASGNVGHSCSTVVVSHGKSGAAVSSVNAQAAAAQASCGPLGSPLTPFTVGDGAIIGPKQ